MTAPGTETVTGEPAPGSRASYDLILCQADRIVFHGHYETPAQRLSMCVGILTASDVFSGTVSAERAAGIHELHHGHVARSNTSPDEAVNAIAKLCRPWGIQLYVGTTARSSAAPPVLYSVITEYGPGQTVAEHFPDRESRSASLIGRAGQFFDAPGHIPEAVLADDHRLAALVATFLMPATVTLTEAAFDATTGAYRTADIGNHARRPVTSSRGAGEISPA
ncbi:hypothetical protein ACFRAU_07235 [Arthrobacter sp. NPDC056691]|uniref:hypothetical protein n=1 Tax=Arthrobacter sp. NPDC056691 TaxID=3345913 RepID=UPI00366FC071